MANTTYNSTDDMIDKLQHLKGKTKLKNYKSLSNYFDKTKIRMDEDPFAENAQSISKIYHEVLLLMNVLQTKPQVKDTNISYYDLYYTVVKNRDEKKIVDNHYENDYIKFIDFITPNHYSGIKNDNVTLR